MPAFVVAGTHSGVGKTSISVGLMAALRRRGLVVQPFKVGPDFIDPAHHALASERISRNLDGWMLNRDANLAVVARAIDGADAFVVEGMMGLFDGVDGASDDGSTAQIAKWLGLPVVLVVDAYALSRSAAAVVKGYAELDPALDVAGAIFNRVGSATHLDWLTDATRSASDVAVLGGIPCDSDVAFPERHLGLVMPDEHRTRTWIEAMADLVERHIDIDALLEKSWTPPTAEVDPASPEVAPVSARIGIARDAAFCFYYQDNVDLLRQCGAELIEFSPLRDHLPPDLDGLYFGGGYPELLAADLARNADALHEVRTFATAGKPIYAECGGLMYLSRGIEDVAGTRHEMCGVLPFWTQLTPMSTLGYAEVTASPETWFPAGGVARGQTFHYSRIHPDDDTQSLLPAYRASVNGSAVDEGFVQHNVVASYLHLHWRSNPEFAKAFVDACLSQPSRDRAGRP
jgi:cobyrinic acid a,c-diamide synthase